MGQLRLSTPPCLPPDRGLSRPATENTAKHGLLVSSDMPTVSFRSTPTLRSAVIFWQVSVFMAHRRFSSRVEPKNDVWVYWEGSGDRDLSRVKDLSIGGLFIQTPRPKRIGSTTSLHFLVQEGQIRADAVVRHVKPGGGLGLQFQAVNEKDRHNLAALMRRLRSLS